MNLVIPRPQRSLDPWVAPAAVAALGCGTVALVAGVGAAQTPLAIGGAAVAGTALVLLIAGGWIDALVLVALSLPLPALYTAGDLRLAPAAPVTAAVVVGWLLVRGSPQRRIDTGRFPLGAALGLMAAFVLAAAFSQHPGAAVRELLNLGVLLLFLAAAIDILAGRPSLAGRLVTAIAGVAAVVGILAVLETFHVLPGRFPEPSGINRAALGFGQPNGLALYLALSLPFAVHLWRSGRDPALRRWWGVGMILVIAGLAATLSRGSWFAVIVAAGALVFVGDWRFPIRVLAVAFLTALVADLMTGGVVRDRVFGILTDWSVAQRAALMLAGVHMFLENPVTGVGPGGFPHELDRIGAIVPRLWDLKPTPHNAYIQVAAETGLVGLAAFLAFLFVVFRRVVVVARSAADPVTQSLRSALLWSFSIACVAGLAEWPLTHGHGQLMMLTAALACAPSITGGVTHEVAS